jgi:hypothetical protein
VSPSPQELAARLLLQGTFGASKADIESVAATYSGNFLGWIQNQMALPASLARAYYRQHSSPRKIQASGGAGGLYKLCEVGSRYHRQVFSYDDDRKKLTVAVSGSVYTLSIDGVVRGEVTEFLGNVAPASTTITFPQDFTICDVLEPIGGDVVLSSATANPGLWCKNSSNSFVNLIFPNPEISFGSLPAAAQSLTGTQVTLGPVTAVPHAVILKDMTVACANRVELGVSFLRHDGTYYKFDQRMKFLENTINNPGNAVAGSDIPCPSVAKTFENAHGCALRDTCAPVTFSDAPITLNDATLRNWYSLSKVKKKK